LKAFAAALLILVSGGLARAGLLEDGILERQEGRFEESVLKFQDLLKQSPDNARAWYEMGLSYASDDQYAKACDAYRLALSHGFSQAQCHCALALALRETQRASAALGEAKRCLQLLPRYAGAYNLIGNAEIDLGHDELALEAYQNAVAIKPAYVNAQFNLGLVYYALGRDDESEAAYHKTLALNPTMAEAWAGLGDCQLRQSDGKQAQRSFLQALKLNSTEPEFEWGLARALRELGRTTEAKEHEAKYRRLLRQSDKEQESKVLDHTKRLGAARESEAWDKELRDDN
jgi:tetratricopeptide (TPR) repeat protein